MDQLVIATQNPGKVAELRELLAGLRLEVLGLDDLGRPFDEPPEHGRTFEDNAAMKARAYAEMTGLPCLADDSGLEVDALDGRPGVDSAWYAYPSEAEAKAHPRSVRDPKNVEQLLAELEGVPLEQRTARFVCCMAVAGPGILETAERRLPVDHAECQGLRLPAKQEECQGLRLSANQAECQGERLPAARRSTRPTHTSNLPHWFLPGKTYHVTFRLQSGTLTDLERRIVYDACLHWHGTRVWMHACVVMPDHVHMLLRPMQTDDLALSRLLHSIKSYSANLINRARGVTGPLWQRESYGRVIRGTPDADSVYRYIESNPVSAGLAEKPGEYVFLWRQGAGRLEAAPPLEKQDRALLGTTPPAHEEQRTQPQPNRTPMTHEAGLQQAGPDTDHPHAFRILATARGTFEGRIGIPPRVPAGSNGFGYDPIFLVAPDFARTSAELSPQQKNQLSHRAAAARKMCDHLAQIVSIAGAD